MYKRLIDYINKYGILTDRQYGFRSKSSTNHAIIELVDKITKAIEKNRSAMRTWGLMLNFIPFGWNAVLKYQHLGVDLLQVKGYTSHYNF